MIVAKCHAVTAGASVRHVCAGPQFVHHFEQI